MKYFAIFVGALCLVGGTHAAATLTETVSTTVNSALLSLNSTFTTVNNTIIAADKLYMNSWTAWGTNVVKNLNSLMTQFKNYNTLNLDSINSTLNSIQSMLNSSKPMLLSDDMTMLMSLSSNVYQLAKQTGELLNVAALNMTAQAVCTNDYSVPCMKKYGANLTASPILLSRFANCISVEVPRLTSVGLNMSSQLNVALATGNTFYDLLKICSIPTAAALNPTTPPPTKPNPSPYASMPPSTQCLSYFLNQITSTPTNSMPSIIDNLRYSTTSLVSSRVNYCTRLVQLDIQDTVEKVQGSFSKCLSTGS